VLGRSRNSRLLRLALAGGGLAFCGLAAAADQGTSTRTAQRVAAAPQIFSFVACLETRGGYTTAEDLKLRKTRCRAGERRVLWPSGMKLLVGLTSRAQLRGARGAAGPKGPTGAEGRGGQQGPAALRASRGTSARRVLRESRARRASRAFRA
jgi:hypothetical protein